MENMLSAIDSLSSHQYRTQQPYFLNQDQQQTLSRKSIIFENLVHKFPLALGKDLSRRERNQREDLEINIQDLTYGEIDFISFGQIFSTIENRYGGIPTGGIFYDLGSGTGKAVISAALLHPFRECRGIQILQGLYQISLQLKEQFKNKTKQILQEYSQYFQYFPELVLEKGDFLSADFRNADFLFANSTCYGKETLLEIGKIQVKPGSMGVSFTKPFGHSSWEVLESVKKEMSWGEATVYIQRKRETQEG